MESGVSCTTVTVGNSLVLQHTPSCALVSRYFGVLLAALQIDRPTSNVGIIQHFPVFYKASYAPQTTHDPAVLKHRPLFLISPPLSLPYSVINVAFTLTASLCSDSKNKAVGDISIGAVNEEGAAEGRGAKVRDTPPQRGPGDLGGVGVGGRLGQAASGHAPEGSGHRRRRP